MIIDQTNEWSVMVSYSSSFFLYVVSVLEEIVRAQSLHSQLHTLLNVYERKFFCVIR